VGGLNEVRFFVFINPATICIKSLFGKNRIKRKFLVIILISFEFGKKNYTFKISVSS